MIEGNIARIRDKIAATCRKASRSPEEITIVCVTKEVWVQEIREVARCGILDIGENRLQLAKEKYDSLNALFDVNKPSLRWHMVGHLQTNKARDAISLFSLIHSVDSVRLGRKIDSIAAQEDKCVDVLVQVNTSGEQTKYGVALSEARDCINELLRFKHMRVRGLMTIAPLTSNPEGARPYFRSLRILKEKINEHLSDTTEKLQHLSMGMSDDFEIAIEEGADIIRIGRAIFKDE
ncbi:YggS family pyridoxal phosphate-dependent enzyme [Candidatus Omnitrophota bacterium]